MISIRKVSKYFGKLRALNEVSLELSSGNCYALIGPNSSGKTTLIKSLLGMIVPDSGEISVENLSIKHQWNYRERIGYMPQIGRYPDNMQIGQLFEMMKGIRRKYTGCDEDLIKSFGLESMTDKRMHTLSGGTRQKVSAALAFLFHPDVLILDEPTAGLDPLAVEILKDKIHTEKRKGKLILITSHVMSDLDELSSHVVYLFEGNVKYHGLLSELKNSTGEERLGRAIANLMISEEPEYRD